MMQMLIRRVLITLAVAGLPFSATSVAAEPPGYVGHPVQPAWTVPLLPEPGMYYTPGRGGTGLTVDVDPSGFVFAIFYAYDEAGRPFYYLMEGEYKPNADLDASNGHIGTLDATPYISEGGECVGTGCSYRSPDRRSTDLHAHIDWITPRHALVTIGTQSWEVWAGDYRVDVEARLEGLWNISAQSRGTHEMDGKILVTTGVVRIAKSALPRHLFTGNDDVVLPPEGSVLYEVTCATPPVNGKMETSCAEVFALLAPWQAPDRAFLWREPDSGMMTLFPANNIMGSIASAGNAGWYYRMYAKGSTITGFASSHRVLSFSKLPADAVAYHPPL